MVVNFEGTSPQTKGPINSTAGSSTLAVYFVVRSITDPTIPNNAGCYRPLFSIFGFSLPVLTRRKFRSTMQEVPAKVKVGISCFSVSDII